MALVLSQKIRILCIETPKSLNKIYAQQLSAAIYSTSAVERATQFYFLLDQEQAYDQGIDMFH